MQVDSTSTFSHSTSYLAPVRNYNASSAAAFKTRGGDRALEKFIHRRQAVKMPTRFAKSNNSSLALTLHGSQDHVNPTSNVVWHTNVVSHRGSETSHEETSEAVLSAIRTKDTFGQANADKLDYVAISPRRLASYAERIGISPYLSVGSLKSKKTGSETREDILNNLLSNNEAAMAASTTLDVRNNKLSFSLCFLSASAD